MIVRDQASFACSIAEVGVALTMITAVYHVLSLMVRFAGPAGGNLQLGSATMNNANLTGVQTFGFAYGLTIISIIIAFIGLAWLWLILLKSKRAQRLAYVRIQSWTSRE